MKKATIIILVFGLLVPGFFEQCKKPAEEWGFCELCGLDSWAGDYTGSGSYYKGETNEIIDGVEVQLEIENPSGNQFLIQLRSPDYYSQSFFSSKSDSNYYFDLAGQSSSIHLSLHKKESDYKVTGVAKKHHWEYKPDTVLVIDHTLTFEVLKNQ